MKQKTDLLSINFQEYLLPPYNLHKNMFKGSKFIIINGTDKSIILIHNNSKFNENKKKLMKNQLACDVNEEEEMKKDDPKRNKKTRN